MNTQSNNNDKGWQFLNIGISAPAPLMEVFQGIVQTTFEEDAKNTDGIFNSKVEIPMEDESLDELLSVEAYGLHGSFATFLSEIQQYNVDTITFGKEWNHAIFKMLKTAGDFIKGNTDNPQAIKNKIISILKVTENAPILGLMSQITVLWGLVRMLECCGMDENSPHFNDFISLHDWIVIEAGKRMAEFSLKPVNMIFGQEDMERIKPFCDYLYYGTDIGKVANEMALGSINESLPEDSTVNGESVSDCALNNTTKVFQAKAGRPKGKTIKPFKEHLLGSDSENAKTMELLRSMLKGKKGKDVALIIQGAMDAGKITKPSFATLKQAFEVYGNESGYNLYMRESWKIDDNDLAKMREIFL